MGDLKEAPDVHFNFPLLSFSLYITFKSGLPLPVSLFLWNRGGLVIARDRLDSSENYLLLGFLLVSLSQTVLLLVRQPITQNNCSISVSYRSSSNVTRWKNLLTLENKIRLLKRVELGQETIKE